MKFQVYFTLVLLCCVTHVQKTSSKIVYVTFVKSHPSPCGPIRLTPGWIALSKSSCGFNCRTRYGRDCRGFMYNRVTRLCTPSSGLSGSFPAPNVTEGDLYLMRSPDIYPDFSIKSDLTGLITANVAYYTNQLNYTDATSTCACLDSHLYLSDTIPKFELLNLFIIRTDNAWIGLDDMVKEGRFVWSGNGHLLNNNNLDLTKVAIFGFDQPDNALLNEDCVYKREGLGLLNDATCYQKMSFLCEKT